MKLLTAKDLPTPPNGKTGWPWTGGNDNTFAPHKYYPKISIVTPSYNQGQYIEETIRSVLLQSYPNLEYIIIDGGSTDNTVEIIHKYEKWITYWVSEPDRGQSHAINKGLQRATGEVFNWLNSDDFLLPDALHAVSESVYVCPTAVAWAGGCYRISSNREVLSKVIPVGLTREQLANWSFGGFLYQPACFFSAKAFLTLNGVDESLRYAMDVDLWIRLSAIGEFQLVPYMVAVALIHVNAKTQRERIAMHADIVAVQIKNGYTSYGIQRIQHLLNEFKPKPRKKTLLQRRFAKFGRLFKKLQPPVKPKTYLTCHSFDKIMFND